MSEKHADFRALGIEVVAISADLHEKNKALAQKLKAPFAMLADPKLEAIRSFGVLEAEHDLAVPAIFILNSDGQTIWREVGEAIQDRVDSDDLLKTIKELQSKGELKARAAQG